MSAGTAMPPHSKTGRVLSLATATAGLLALDLLDHGLGPLRRRLGPLGCLLHAARRCLGPSGGTLRVLGGRGYPRLRFILALAAGQDADHHEAREASSDALHHLQSPPLSVGYHVHAGLPAIRRSVAPLATPALAAQAHPPSPH